MTVQPERPFNEPIEFYAIQAAESGEGAILRMVWAEL